MVVLIRKHVTVVVLISGVSGVTIGLLPGPVSAEASTTVFRPSETINVNLECLYFEIFHLLLIYSSYNLFINSNKSTVLKCSICGFDENIVHLRLFNGLKETIILSSEITSNDFLRKENCIIWKLQI